MRSSTPTDNGVQIDGAASASLIRRIVDGDASAMMTLYDTTKCPLFGLVVRIVKDRFAAEEVLLDAYSKVWRRAESFDPAADDAMAWLIGIARTCSIDRLRATTPGAQGTEAPGGADNPTESDRVELQQTSELRRLVSSAFDSLPPEQRQPIELAYYQGLSHSEIAGRLEQPLETINKRTRLGMTRLGDLLRPLFIGND